MKPLDLNHVNLYRRLNTSNYMGGSSNSWFDTCEYVNFEIDKHSLTIKKCDIDIDKNARKVSKNKNYYSFAIHVKNHSLPLGKHLIDESESNEDELKIYFKNENL